MGERWIPAFAGNKVAFKGEEGRLDSGFRRNDGWIGRRGEDGNRPDHATVVSCFRRNDEEGRQE